MSAFLLAAGLVAGASAIAVPRTDGCCFQLSANGAVSGTLGQLGDGQNRVGGGYPPATYCINNGAITDGNGRGCILTPPTTQFQCDVGATPTSGFSIGSNGDVQYMGSSKFYACAATVDNPEYNIYTVPVKNQANCYEITLNTGGACAAKPPPPPPSKSTPPPPPPPSKSIPVKTCPTDLSGPHQTPHLIVPISKSHPDTAYGTQYNATITPDECTIFNYDIPYSYSGKDCSVIFLFPEQKDLQTSAFDFSGSGEIVFSELSSAASQMTTYNNCPAKKKDLGKIAAKPGNSYFFTPESCEAGKTVSIEACSSGGLSLTYFQDWNPSPIGAYITQC